MLNKNEGKNFSSLKYVKKEIQRMPYLFQTEGKYKGNMKRTTAGGVWLNGYSDHLPVVVYVAKESGRTGKVNIDGKLPEYTEAEQQFMDKCAEELKGYIAKEAASK